MTIKLDTLQAALHSVLGDQIVAYLADVEFTSTFVEFEPYDQLAEQHVITMTMV